MRYDILLVEDDEDHAALAAIAIGKTANCRLAKHVTSLQAARQWLANHHADAVLLDLSLPDGTGMDSIKAVRAAAAECALIVITAHDDAGTAQHSLAAGAQDYLPKQTHLTAPLLERAIVYAIERQRRHVELQRFVSAAAHDIQAPVRQMRGFAGILLERHAADLPDAAVAHLRFIDEGAARLQAMVNALLRYARAGGRVLQTKNVDVQAVVTRVCASLSGELAAASATIETSNLGTVFADAHLLESVVQNLIENAVKYRAQRPLRLHISQTKRGTEQVLQFSDNGRGIAKRDLERAMLPFERAYMKNRGNGVGLGLALCKRVAEAHRGCVWLESEESVGTTAYVALPDVSYTPKERGGKVSDGNSM